MRWLTHGGIPVLGFGALFRHALARARQDPGSWVRCPFRGSLLVGAPRLRLLISGGVVDVEEEEVFELELDELN